MTTTRPTIRCAHCRDRHFTVAQVRDCAFPPVEFDADDAYVRHLENQGYDEAREDEYREMMFAAPW